MKNPIILITFLSFFILFGCNKEVEKPKVAYSKKPKTTVQQIDTAKIQVADLPIQFEGTKYLIFPIGNLSISENGSKYESISKNGDQSFTVSNNMDNEITGYLQNLKFQTIGSEEFTTLTDKPVLIESITYLKSIATISKQQILVYQLTDNDSNDDGKLDTNDIKSLYLSKISGDNFTKIINDKQEILNWKIIESQNRLYFKSIEDSNKNGKFEANDKIHYGFVNLLEKEWKAVEFNLN